MNVFSADTPDILKRATREGYRITLVKPKLIE